MRITIEADRPDEVAGPPTVYAGVSMFALVGVTPQQVQGDAHIVHLRGDTGLLIEKLHGAIERMRAGMIAQTVIQALQSRGAAGGNVVVIDEEKARAAKVAGQRTGVIGPDN